MDDLVIMHNQQAVTTSVKVANIFEKKHKHVLDSINTILRYSAENSAQSVSKMFITGSYTDASGKSNKMYYMNRDGFSLLAMGFTGKKALDFKLQYIQAFNRMESYVNNDLAIKNLQKQIKQNQAEMLKVIDYKKAVDNNKESMRSYYKDEVIPLGRFAEIFSRRHKVNLTRVRLFRYLRKHKILEYKKYDKSHNYPKNKKYNAPKAKYFYKGYFSLRDVRKSRGIFKVLFVTLKGQEWLDQMLSNNMEKLMSPNLK